MKRLPYLILTVFLLAVGGFGWYWWQVGRFVETTDNAYIRGEITPISVKVSGYVAQVLVADNQFVAAGQPLVRIEDHEFRVQFEQGKSAIAERQAALQVVREKRQRQGARIDLERARLAGAEAEFERRQRVFQRLKNLHAEQAVAEQVFETAEADLLKAQAERDGAAANLQIAQREVDVLAAEQTQIAAAIRSQQEQLKLLQQAVEDTCVCAPVAGRIGNRRVREGQYVRPGSTLMALIPQGRLWVEANFKELQVRRMRPGQPVEIAVDAFPDEHFSGRIESLSPASGAEFSLLPPENASGNFTKIVQRIPVKIVFDASDELDGTLRPGMSVEVRLDTRSAEDDAGTDRMAGITPAGHRP